MLRIARDAREMTQSGLADAATVTQALISKLENGLITEPSREVVEAIAAALRFPTKFFYQEDRAIGFPHFHYRKRAKLGVGALNKIEAILNIRRMHIARLLRSYEDRPLKPIPQIDLDATGSTPEQVAEKMRAYWVLNRGPIDNLTRVIEEAGGIIVSANFGTQLLDGVSLRVEGLPPLFFMNRDMPGDRYRFSLAHELGHMVLHALPGDDGEMEDQAHRFAASFLMPAADIKPYIADIKFSNLTRVKAYWKVSIKALIKRAHDLKIITDYQYRHSSIMYNKVFKGAEPGHIGVENPDRLRFIFNYHVKELGYSNDEMAELLALNADDVSRLYLGRPGLRLVSSN
jgi:Zn-dependent peptidase ImmA (M78 family)/transcriptional regulator with XRE-family HTH domain